MFQNQLDFVCDYCSRSFTRKYNLQTHIENCHLYSTSSCDICNQKFGSPAGLQLHLTRGHNRFSQPFPECDICGRIFTRKQNISSHMITVHLQGLGSNIRCRICYKTFTTERNLKRHVNQLHNPNVKYPTCDVCNKVFKGKQSLIAHIQASHGSSGKGMIRCHLCAKVYTNNRNVKRHIETFHGERGEYKCDTCPKLYTSKQSLRRHVRTSHTDCQDKTMSSVTDNVTQDIDFCDTETKFNIDEYTCETCNKYFDEELMLRRHIKTEHSFKSFYRFCKKSLERQMLECNTRRSKFFFNCEYCHNVFTSVYELKDHMRTNHDKEYSLSTCKVCFSKFYTKQTAYEHKKICLPPPNVNSCSHCDKLFTDISSLEFHIKIFHPQAQIADTNITSTNLDESSEGCFRCLHCDRVYYSDRSLKHHIKLKHTTDEEVECELCQKICSNKYYLASHMKIVHSNDSWSKCDYCDKLFKSKRNIRRHIEYTHLGMQRYKCVECETLFKEKRSLRKHVRTKHPNSVAFPQCHFCHKRFESAKSCKIHLKLLHSFNMNTYPCDLCSVSFTCNKALNIHLETKHLAEDEIYKCEDCNIVFKGHENFEEHNALFHVSLMSNVKQKVLPRCVICIKDFSSRKSLKRHIKKFHEEFNVDELATFGSSWRVFNVECVDCIKCLNDDFYYNIYLKLKHLTNPIIFKCETCHTSFNALEYSIQRYKLSNFVSTNSEMILSELCTAEMSDDEVSRSGIEIVMEPESTTVDIKTEPMSP